jgi:hypothetical protein
LWFVVQNFWTKFKFCSYATLNRQHSSHKWLILSCGLSTKNLNIVCTLVRSSRACVCLVSNLISFGFEIVQSKYGSIFVRTNHRPWPRTSVLHFTTSSLRPKLTSFEISATTKRGLECNVLLDRSTGLIADAWRRPLFARSLDCLIARAWSRILDDVYTIRSYRLESWIASLQLTYVSLEAETD